MAANTLEGNSNGPKPRRTGLTNKPGNMDRLVGYKKSQMVRIFTTTCEWIRDEAEREFDGWDLLSVERRRYKLQGIATILAALKEGRHSLEATPAEALSGPPLYQPSAVRATTHQSTSNTGRSRDAEDYTQINTGMAIGGDVHIHNTRTTIVTLFHSLQWWRNETNVEANNNTSRTVGAGCANPPARTTVLYSY